MKPLPMILGAMSLAVATGALAGASLPTTPITRHGDILAEVPRHQVQSRTIEETHAMIAPRDHYPLETPAGVIPVAELEYHGRLRNRMREQPLYGAETEAEAFGMERPDTIALEAEPASRIVVADSRPVAAADLAQASVAARLPDNFVPLEEGIFEQR